MTVKKAFLSIDAQASVDIKALEKKLSESTEMKLYADFMLDTMPTSFSEGIESFKTFASKWTHLILCK